MSWQSFVELDRLLQNGLPGQWVVRFLLRKHWLPDYLFLTHQCPKCRSFLKGDPQANSWLMYSLVKKLKKNNKTVFLVSGGFHQMINPIASILRISSDHIYANQLLFGSSVEYAGFDPNEPISRSGGKATAVQQIRKAKGYKFLVMIGDGAIDLAVRNTHLEFCSTFIEYPIFQARKLGGADLFICYGGLELSEQVAAQADWLVYNFKDLINTLD